MLKRIEIKGFKSFADKTVIDFEKGITCIVGPNGSGKSNITDAFRWVLGEQSYKSLRGSQMSDVIFNGTVSRQALGYAEVCVVLDNTDGRLNLPYSEISVLRKLYRSGESEYLINGNICRLKDIRELFVDTGVGVEGYSIIGQGRIDRLLSSGKEDRRLIFEEASGIVKYRTKKQEAERKLDKTQTHIERIEDIALELESRLGPLKEQSEKAIEYNKITAELRSVEISLYLQEIDKIKEELTIYNTNLNKLENESEEVTEKLLKYREENAKTSSELDITNSLRSKLSIKRTELEKSKIESEGKLELLNEKLSHSEKMIEEIEFQKNLLSEGSADLEKEIKISEDKFKIMLEEYKIREEKLNALKAEFDFENTALSSMETELALIKLNKREYFEKQDSLSLKRAELKAKIDLCISRRDILNKEISEGVKLKDSAFVKLQEIQTKLSDSEAVLKKYLDEKAEIESKISDKKIFIENAENDIYRLRDSLNKKKSAYDVLDKKIHSFENLGTSIAEVMKKSADDERVLGTIGSLVEIEEKFEVALEEILGRRLENVVTKNFDAAREYIEYLKSENAGRLTFMPLDTLKPNDVIKIGEIKGIFGTAMDFVKCSDEAEPAVRYLLYNVCFAEDLISAKKAQEKLPNGYKIVTLDGDVVNVGGTVSGGFSKKKKNSGIFQEKRELEEYKNQIYIDDKNLKELESKRDSAMKYVKEISDTINDLQNKIEEAKNIFSEYRINLDIIRREISDGMNAESGKQKQFEENETLIDVITADLRILDSEEKELNKLKEDSEKKSYDIKAAIDNKRIEVEALQGKINEEKLSYVSYSYEVKELETALDNLKKETGRRKIETENLNKDKIKLNSQKEDFIKEIREKNDEILKNTAEHEYVNKEITVLETKIRELKDKSSVNLKEYRDLETKAGELKDEMYIIRINTGKLDTRLEVQTQGLWTDYNMSYAGALEHKIDLEYKDAKKLVRGFKNELQELGEVNQLSIKEYDEVNERYMFLSAQKNDLIETSKKLNKIIREMDREMRTRFKESIEDINQKFNEAFRGLFRGGMASIELSVDDDILEAEIIINAQPPGKKLQTLELLSGGEKALTAISILFAILKTKPAPFCILDEIEAALDDRNIALFSSFVKDYIEKSQFIIITHRKGTMEIADAIYGVTMKEKGVTGMLSLKLTDDAEKMLGIS